MPYKAALLDFNGTAADDAMICYQCVVQIFRVFGPSLPIPSFEEWQKGHGNANFLEFYYVRGIPRTITIGDMRSTWKAQYSAGVKARGGIIVRDGVQEFLRFCRLKEFFVAIVSSSNDDVECLLRRSNVHNFFHELYIGVPDKKRAFEGALSDFGISPEEAFYVDDTHDGIMSAKQVGIGTFGFTNGCNHVDRIREAEPNHLVGSFSEIREILEC